MAHFCKEFRPEKGDLIYGISEPRSRYMDHYEYDGCPCSHHIALAGTYNDGHWATIDDYNSLLLGDQCDQVFDDEREVDRIVQQAQQIVDKSPTQGGAEWLVGNYFLALTGSRYRPAHAPKAELSKRVKNLCKFGIALAASRFGGRVHFVLDGLDIGKIARNEPIEKGEPLPVTHSELRYVYRHFKELSRLDAVRFYINYTVVTAPWKQDWKHRDYRHDVIKACKSDWDKYGEQRQIRKRADKPLL